MVILVLTVPIFFPVALSLGIDPINLGILTALAIEIGSVIPPVGLNLFAVSGATGLPLTQVIRGSFPFCCSDTVVLIIVLLFPTLALWLPDLLQTSNFLQMPSLAIYFFRFSRQYRRVFLSPSVMLRVHA